MDHQLLFNYVTKDGGVILVDSQTQIIKTISPQKTVTNNPDHLDVDGKMYKIPSNAVEVIKESYARLVNVWQQKIEFLQQLSYYRLSRIELPCSNLNDRVRVVGKTPLADKMVVSSLLYQDLMQQKSRKRVGQNGHSVYYQHDSRIFVKLSIDQHIDGLLYPPMIVLEVLDGGEEITFTGPVDFNLHPVDEDFSQWCKDICTFNHCVPTSSNEFTFIYSVKLPDWVNQLVGTQNVDVQFGRGASPRQLFNVQLVNIEFIDHLPYIENVHVYLSNQDSVEYYCNQAYQPKIHAKMKKKITTSKSLEWQCGHCQFFNTGPNNCQMCHYSFNNEAQLNHSCPNLNETIATSYDQDFGGFVCQFCDFYLTLDDLVTNSADTGDLFQQRELACFCTGMTLTDPEFDITFGSLITYYDPKFDVPVAIVPCDAVQYQMTTEYGINVNSGELSRLYYEKPDPVEMYENCEYRYYFLLNQLIQHVVNLVITEELDDQIENEVTVIIKKLDELDQVCNLENIQRLFSYRQEIEKLHQVRLNRFRQLKDEKQQRYQVYFQETRQLGEFLKNLKTRPVNKFWQEIKIDNRPIRRLNLIGVYLILSLVNNELSQSILRNLQGPELTISAEICQSIRTKLNLTEFLDSIIRLNDKIFKGTGGVVLFQNESDRIVNNLIRLVECNEPSTYIEVKSKAELAIMLNQVLEQLYQFDATID